MQDLKTITSYKSSFGLVKFICIAFLACMTFFGCFVYYLFVTKGNKGYETIYIIDSSTGAAYEAKQTSIYQNPERKAEYKNHVKMFYSNFYMYDQHNFKENVENALNLVGDCGKQMRNDLIESETQRKLTVNNIVMTVKVDTVDIDMDARPITGMAIATHTLKRPSSEVKYKTWSTFKIEDLLSRSDANPHGCLIEDFKIIKKETIVSDGNSE